jgi:MFS transporter, CP family, cyanate transporter
LRSEGVRQVSYEQDGARTVLARPSLRLLIGLFAVTLALRPQIVGIAPLLPRIQAELGVAHWVAGLLSTIPVICMGLFAPLGPWVASHLGPRRALAACLLSIVLFGLARAASPAVVAVMAMTLGVGLGIGTAGALMSIVVGERVPARPALATGAYAAGIVAGSFTAAALAVPVADAFGGWRSALALFSIAPIASLAAWLILVSPDQGSPLGRVRPTALPWRARIAWGLMIVFGLQSLLYYGVISWLPAIYVERGWTESSAGALVALVNLIALASGIVVPIVADRVGSRRTQLTAIAVVVSAALAGVSVVPDAGSLWAVCLGFGLGALLPLALTLPVDVARAPGEVGAVAAFMLLGGYLIAGIGPVLLGLIRDATGDFGGSLWLLTGLAVVFAMVSWLLSPARLSGGVSPRAV